MVAAAEKEGKVVWYSSVDVKVAEGDRQGVPRGISEYSTSRSSARGSERVFQRINQEYQSGIKNVDVVNSSDASHFIFWKQQKWLAPHTPPDVKRFAAQYKDPEGYYAAWRATLERDGLQHQAVEAKDAPKGYMDLLDPEVEGQAREGAPRLQRHRAHRHLRDRQGARLGLPREARRSRACSSCSRRPRRRRASRAASAP